MKGNSTVLKHRASLKRKTNSKKQPIEGFEKFLKNGGEVSIEIPKINHIIKAIDSDKLVIALLYSGALGSKKKGGGFHFVVVTGYKKNYVHINNPSKNSTQGWFKEEDFLYAVHSSIGADVDNASLLIV